MITIAQLLPRWPRHVAQFEFSLFNAEYLSFTHCSAVISERIAINYILRQTRYHVLHFCRRLCGTNFNHFHVIGPQFGEIIQNNGNYAVQCHSFINDDDYHHIMMMTMLQTVNTLHNRHV